MGLDCLGFWCLVVNVLVCKMAIPNGSVAPTTPQSMLAALRNREADLEEGELGNGATRVGLDDGPPANSGVLVYFLA